MINVYVYVLDTMADWEIGYVTAELNSKRFFKKDAEEVLVKTVGSSKSSIKTMGGLNVLPDCVVEEIEENKSTVLILPGADTWGNSNNFQIIEKAKKIISVGGTVCAICGATVALANFGLLDNCFHTSNGVGFLDMFAPAYKGKSFYRDEKSVSDKNIITAGSTSPLLWAKQIIEWLGVFSDETLNAWYDYFSTGKADAFYTMMSSVQK